MQYSSTQIPSRVIYGARKRSSDTLDFWVKMILTKQTLSKFCERDGSTTLKSCMATSWHLKLTRLSLMWTGKLCLILSATSNVACLPTGQTSTSSLAPILRTTSSSGSPWVQLMLPVDSRPTWAPLSIKMTRCSSTNCAESPSFGACATKEMAKTNGLTARQKWIGKSLARKGVWMMVLGTTRKKSMFTIC